MALLDVFLFELDQLLDAVMGLRPRGRGWRKREEDLLTTGDEIVSPTNAWMRGASRLDEAQLQAVIEALVLMVRYDGTVTSAEKVALANETGEIAEARYLGTAQRREIVGCAELTVDAALGTVSPREDATRARRDGAAKLVASIAAKLPDRAVRRTVLHTLVRIARGSSGNAAANDELLEWFARAFDLSLPES